MDEILTIKDTDSDKIRETIYHFISWLDYYGAFSQDQYDFWACKFGQISKAAFYKGSLLGKTLVAPIVFLDTLLPASRSIARKRTRFPIADAHYAMAFFTLSEIEANQKWLDTGHAFLESLISEKSPGINDYSWGYPFDWETCFGSIKTGTPLITTIPYVYEAFETGYEISNNPEYRFIMESIAKYSASHFSGKQISPDIEACSYTPYDQRMVVNANAYRGFLLTSAGHRFNNIEWQSIGRRNLNFVLMSQQNDGSWFYAMDGKDAFIDNFHTCFVLKNLCKAWRHNKDSEIFTAIHKGFDFYKKSLLTQKFLPIPFAKKQRMSFITQELYDYAEGINLCLLLSETEKDAQKIMKTMVIDLIKNWVLADGHFCTRKLWIGKNTIPYHRWAQSQLFLSLVNYYSIMVK